MTRDSHPEKYPVVILARGGSKGIPGKNIRNFCGKPLLAWTILQAKAARLVSEVFVSSDAPEILKVAKDYGARTIFRPKDLSTDQATSESGWLHALKYIRSETLGAPKATVALQATSPLREPKDIDEAIAFFQKKAADSLFSATKMDDITLWKQQGTSLSAVTYDPNHRGRRQDRPPYLLENGSIYIFKNTFFQRSSNRLGGRLVTFNQPFWKSLEIDDAESFGLCELVFANRLLQKSISLLPKRPKLIVYDFDGVMTNNRALITETGVEAVWINRSDGWAIESLRKAGIRQLIISTEKNPVVSARAKKLQIEVIQGTNDKIKTLQKICSSAKIPLSKVLFIGNDLNDLPAIKKVGLAIAPQDGHPEVLKNCHFVTRAKGGEGVVREIAELLLCLKQAD